MKKQDILGILYECEYGFDFYSKYTLQLSIYTESIGLFHLDQHLDNCICQDVQPFFKGSL